MADLDLQGLRAEREARRRNQPNELLSAAAAPRPTVRPNTFSGLQRAPRSIRLAHTIGIILCTLGLLVAWLWSVKWGAVLFAGGGALGRAGGAWLHTILPSNLQEGSPPPATSSVDGHVAMPRGPIHYHLTACTRLPPAPRSRPPTSHPPGPKIATTK